MAIAAYENIFFRHMRMYKHTDTQTHKIYHIYIYTCTDRGTQTDRDRQTDRQAGRQAGRQADIDRYYIDICIYIYVYIVILIILLISVNPQDGLFHTQMFVLWLYRIR